ncbi:MAG: hypothetical protein M4579_001081 [Chaenotheca gracillima]|nr:MAG: hypothetical protein M4579_001081 [Chaenotheca gracillima]
MSASDSYFTSIPGYTTLSDQAQGSKAPPSTPVRVRSRRKYWPLLKAKVDLSMDPNGTGSTRSRSYRSRVIQQVSQTLDGGAGHHERRRDSGNSERSSETVIVTDTNSRSQSGASTTFDLNGSSAISGAPFDRSTPASGNRKTVRIPIPARGGSIKAANPTRGLSLDSGGGSGRRRSSANGKPAARVHFAMDDPSDLHQSEVFRERLYPIPFSALKLEPRLCSDYPTQPLRHKHKLLGRPQTPLPSPTLVNAFKATDPTFGRPRQKKIRSWIPPYLRRSDRHTRTLEARHGTREVSRALWDGRTHHTPPGRQSLGKAFESQGNGEDRFQDAFMDFGSPVNDEIHPVAYANQCLEERQAKIKSEDFDGTSERLSRNSHEVKTTSWPLRVKPHPKYRVAVFSPEDAVQPREEHFLDSYSMNDYPRATARMAASDPNDLSSASKPETDGQKSDGQDELVRLRQWSLPARPKDWSHTRKRFAASVVCSNTALIGLVVGIYAGEVPAFQYQLADMGHYTVLGNVVFYVGLSIPTLLCWTLPLIYGRKPFNVMALGLFLPLQLPQAVVLSSSRSPDNASYRTGLLVARALSGIALGFLNTNMLGSLVELFGASLHNSHPHQETFKRHDLRRHGGGMGVWLGVWTWSFVGSVGLGFLFGALIINQLNPVWGFWITSALSAVMLLLNMATPEIRDPLDQWSAAQHYLGSQRSSEGLRGNATILRSYATPQRLWHEIQAGVALKCSMLSQVGFTPLALYVSWIYGHAVMVMIVSKGIPSKMTLG